MEATIPGTWEKAAPEQAPKLTVPDERTEVAELEEEEEVVEEVLVLVLMVVYGENRTRTNIRQTSGHNTFHLGPR